MPYPHEEVEATIRGLAEAFEEAQRTNSWSWIADRFYHEDCVYTCPYGGTMLVVANGREEIRNTHYGRDMDVGSGWQGWSFPIIDWAINGNRIISHWVNRGPGLRADGSYYQTHGVSFITYGGDGKFSEQYDLFDLAHQLRLCDELDDAGLLDPRLREEWVAPMKQRLVAMLGATPGG
ncbi:MAG: nuclear transport factor 2 family protein [Halieaceae bacterium]|nr:nuclear transport factor 2 family protein [Halieaceae bacterium]MCP5203175.1 nuclear transport factor 2 family protein [Pseudomonadales bacterium]